MNPNSCLSSPVSRACTSTVLAVLALIAIGDTDRASAHPVISIDLNVDEPGIQTTRTVFVGKEFGIALYVGDDGPGATFDTIILEIFMNDAGEVLGVNPDQPPIALDLADNSPTTVDAFTLEPIDPFDALFLTPPSIPPEPFTLATGMAGLSDFGSPFVIASTDTISVAAGKVNPFGFTPLIVGQSTLLASPDIAFLEVPLDSVTVIPSVVTVRDAVTAPVSSSVLRVLLVAAFALTGGLLVTRRRLGWRLSH